ncbi:uncharacterized protein LOC109718939 [Ananas comosus]|uniref:Uncharacterized protein LOC109718939 n=1 Tax=Ananas comosus TaxID=4615 RepID=A0A199VR31_ANACO|nr:uncharacterized protein LOC109718939 [Ananas comosus]OAY79468.1 hypothetical protein ACMD2_07526 [Ananas comosus]
MEATVERREQQQQQQQQPQQQQQDVKLPLESSPYVGYKDVEDYKMRGYGAHGHLPTVDQVSGGGTDAPTLSGSGLSERQAHASDPAAAP